MSKLFLTFHPLSTTKAFFQFIEFKVLKQFSGKKQVHATTATTDVNATSQTFPMNLFSVDTKVVTIIVVIAVVDSKLFRLGHFL